MNQLTLEKNKLFYYLENIKSENLGFSFSLLLLEYFEISSLLKNYSNKTPLKKMAKSEEIASVALFLASENSGSITGLSYSID